MPKNIRNIKTLLVVLAACALVFFGIKLVQKIIRSSGPGIKTKAANITALRLDSPLGSYNFKKEGKPATWKVASASGAASDVYYECDQRLVENIINKIETMKLTDVVSDSESRWEEFQVCLPQGVRVEFTDKKGRRTAFLIGRFGYDQEHFYFRFEGQKQTWLETGFEGWVGYGNLDYWRDKRILNFDRAKITEIEITEPAKGAKEKILLKKTSDYWEILSGAPGEFRKAANQGTIDQLLMPASTLDGDEFAGPQDKIKKVQMKITIKTAEQTAELVLGDLANSKYLIKKTGGEHTYRIYEYKFAPFKKSRSDF